MSSKRILILTDKPKPLFIKAFRYLKLVIKEGVIQGAWEYVFRSSRFGGSVEIPRNLLQGLQHQSLQFATNVYNSKINYDLIVVVKDIDALKWALVQKQAGLTKQLVVGPFISTLPSDNHSILETPFIDRLIFLCTWHQKIFLNLYQQTQKLSSVWFAGVDPERWRPSLKAAAKKSVLIYKKWPHPTLYTAIENYLKEKEIPFQIIEVGFYEPQDYQKLLDQSLLTLFISHSETQGLAIFESWSMNVPTFHWDPEFMNYYETPYPESSSAPYLTKDLGSSFKDFEDFKNKFLDFYENCYKLQPRKIILEKYTNAHSADLFISILNQHLN